MGRFLILAILLIILSGCATTGALLRGAGQGLQAGGDQKHCYATPVGFDMGYGQNYDINCY